MLRTKKGLSPVIATTLLVLLVVIIAVIIFIWARSFFTEKAQKDLGNGLQPIEKACEEIIFTADVASSNKVTIENKGNVPIIGVALRKSGFAFNKKIGTNPFELFTNSQPVKSGENNNVQVTGATLTAGDTVLVAPVIQGLIEQTKKNYICDDKYALSVKVS